MVRAFLEELASLVALSLFIACIAVWAAIIISTADMGTVQ